MIKNILIVDDHVSFLEGLSRALSRYCEYGGEIRAVSDGENALAEIRSRFYDICFLDLNLPDVNGLEVMEVIRRISPETRVVIMTSEYIEDDVREKIEKNASLFIPKPVELDDIRDYIKKESERSGGNGREGHNGDLSVNEKRQSAREPYKIRVHCCICVFYNWELKSDMEADIIDLSTDGIGIKLDYPVYPGNVLRFDNALGNRNGMVKWSCKENERYRAGIKFL